VPIPKAGIATLNYTLEPRLVLPERFCFLAAFLQLRGQMRVRCAQLDGALSNQFFELRLGG
jgi:hypothetical protein